MDKEELRREIIRKQAEMEAVQRRMMQYRDAFRDERDALVIRGIQEGIPKKELAMILGVSVTWLNKLVKGEAYRRSTD